MPFSMEERTALLALKGAGPSIRNRRKKNTANTVNARARSKIAQRKNKGPARQMRASPLCSWCPKHEPHGNKTTSRHIKKNTQP